MSWRTVIVSNQCKLDYKMGFMIIRGETTQELFLDEVAILVLENPAVSLTGCLVEALVEKKIKVIFCDSKRSPTAEIVPYYGSHDCSRKIKTQFSWSDNTKAMIWQEIIAEKIRKQAEFLNDLEKNKERDLLLSYIGQVEEYDATNREGHAAKVYFNALFGMNFTRSADNNINAALNYGYSLILSAFNREVAICGYLTQLGLFHSNMFNFYNLSCDLMEPFRVLVDRKVYGMNHDIFDKDEKHFLWNILKDDVIIGNEHQLVLNAIKIYTKSVFEAINDSDPSQIKFARIR